MAKYWEYIAQIGLVMLILLVVAGLAFLSFRDLSLAWAPVLLPSATPRPTSTPIPTMTPTPMATTEKVAGPVWVLTRIEVGLFHENGYDYDIATFTNLDKPSVTIRARCSTPGWPTEIGHQYIVNEYRVMIPIEGIFSPLQRFWVLE